MGCHASLFLDVPGPLMDPTEKQKRLATPTFDGLELSYPIERGAGVSMGAKGGSSYQSLATDLFVSMFEPNMVT